ncbi:C3a anaphylatoxin chemotactic receptor [Brienomyrus brachyistius]|uniref:C3a anaphylatoxin chemotactic receptor n=1 Tax=Brienomyrus brachyistius TaxID=42636 RepID=UPI0020B2F1AA|nr:C3a anaphylatoxin chemotactic receptor [Brienomyrus brachyistius]XP_048882629.1 C3a anaphylatoxin chemotactic receptor [Brienomyrus brachyistius]XP_048882630.1 C3a anaphylatoxin chemotactic receptor [Brienomyrus brachyistius]
MGTPLLNQTQSSTAAGGQQEAIRVIQIVITTLIFLVGIPLNSLVVWVLGLRRGWRGKGMEGRSAGSFRTYVVNLALADLVLLLRTPLMLGYLAHHNTWPFGLTACRLIMFLRGLGLYANAFLLCVISMERCLCLIRPLWFRMRRSRWTVPLVCLVLWVLAISLSTPYVGTAILINETQCWESDRDHPGSVWALFVTESVLGFILPLLIFLTSNMVVLVTARQASEAVSPVSNSSSVTSLRFTRLYRVLFLTMLFFLTCWVPYYTFRSVISLKGTRELWVTKGLYVSLYLVYLKSALNPLLYVFATRGLSRTIRASLLSTVDRIFNDDTSDYSRRRSLRKQDSQL